MHKKKRHCCCKVYSILDTNFAVFCFCGLNRIASLVQILLQEFPFLGFSCVESLVHILLQDLSLLLYKCRILDTHFAARTLFLWLLVVSHFWYTFFCKSSLFVALSNFKPSCDSLWGQIDDLDVESSRFVWLLTKSFVFVLYIHIYVCYWQILFGMFFVFFDEWASNFVIY